MPGCFGAADIGATPAGGACAGTNERGAGGGEGARLTGADIREGRLLLPLLGILFLLDGGTALGQRGYVYVCA